MMLIEQLDRAFGSDVRRAVGGGCCHPCEFAGKKILNVLGNADHDGVSSERVRTSPEVRWEDRAGWRRFERLKGSKLLNDNDKPMLDLAVHPF